MESLEAPPRPEHGLYTAQLAVDGLFIDVSAQHQRAIFQQTLILSFLDLLFLLLFCRRLPVLGLQAADSETLEPSLRFVGLEEKKDPFQTFLQNH